MTDASGIDWEDAFANAAHIPGGEGFPDLWQTAAERFRGAADGQIDIAYGDAPRARLDLFRPSGPARGLAVFLHGGFWLAFDKSYWSHLASGALAHGWAVALPSYTLAPEARVGEIVLQVGRAVACAAGMIDGPFRLAGHSAGGHLAARMVCEDSPLPAEIGARIARVVSISGVHDLRPLQLHSMNRTLRLDPDEAAAESPVLHRLRPGVAVTAWVGAAERPEFLRQSALLAEAWQVPLVADPGRHHFDVIDGQADPAHPLSHCLAGE
ncbi:alpha/beta hydrolase [Ovoidimarina sediminis]|uniref:alpha/beta hydrolase n=1 Tax=Ovoidimarina sediminis TaxID=3079856 RepID=UPI00290A4B0F|nr:alpha/beta hydrolase [Rhodophyticola sp. MJ-SS7]MDU8944130.1 alpha/beta hydrolase [Rhodophyticola sp. MJ-SS7]